MYMLCLYSIRKVAAPSSGSPPRTIGRPRLFECLALANIINTQMR